MSVTENKAIVRRLVEARNRNEVNASFTFFPAERQEQVRVAFNVTSEAFPDVHIRAELKCRATEQS